MTLPNCLRTLCLAGSVSISAAIAPAQISVIGQLTDDRTVAPGASYDGTITVRNETDVPQEVKVYQTDYFFSYDGTTVYGEPGEAVRSNANWVRYTPTFIRLDPSASSVVSYSVKVPDSAAGKPLEGSYWSMLMIEGIVPGSPESSKPAPDRNQMGISQLIRYGVQIATHIAGTGKIEARFLDVRVQTEEDGTRLLVVDIQNIGDLWFRPTFSAEIFDASGASKGIFQGSQLRIYPGTSVQQRINLGKIARGTYTVMMILDAGGEDVVGAEYTLTL